MRLLFLLLFASSLLLQANSTDEILVSVQRTIEKGDSFSDLDEVLSNLSIGELKDLSTTLEAAWPVLQKNYLTHFDEAVKEQFAGSNRSQQSKRVRELRKEFHAVRALSEDQMKAKLKEVSMPALTELHTLLLPTSKDVLAKAPDTLKNERKLVRGFARFRDLLQEHSISVGADDTPKEVTAAEEGIMADYQTLDRKGLRIIEDNDKIAARADLPPAERQGIRELNLWRLLLEQNALEIDPKLCEAGRGHSQDMAEKGFFAHISPIAGKESPSNRAQQAGTTGGGENIYMGSTKPEGANKGWFFSPGHHKNMFNPGYGRVGLGQFNRHWTQMFGR